MSSFYKTQPLTELNSNQFFKSNKQFNLMKKHVDISSAKRRSPAANLILHVKSQTWNTDTHGLFDYEERTTHLKTFKSRCINMLEDQYHIVRVGTDVFFLQEKELPFFVASFPNTCHLVQLEWHQGHLCIVPNSHQIKNIIHESPWLVARCFQNATVALQEGDRIKLGKYCFTVRETVHSEAEDKAKREQKQNRTTQSVPTDGSIEKRTLEYASSNLVENRPNILKPFGDFRPLRSTLRQIHDSNHLLLNNLYTDINTIKGDIKLSKRFCRICLTEDGDDMRKECFDVSSTLRSSEYNENPLIAPCGCRGSMKWVHLDCLRAWVAGRLNVQKDVLNVHIFWRSLECELCHLPYPSFLNVLREPFFSMTPTVSREKSTQINSVSERPIQKTSLFRSFSYPSNFLFKSMEALPKPPTTDCIELFELPRPPTPYVILEPMRTESPGLHIISFANRGHIGMGRGNESDIHISDISVSRLHAFLRFQIPPLRNKSIVGSHGPQPFVKGEFVITDMKSKFGTLLELRDNFPIGFFGHPVVVQAGRTILSFKLAYHWTRYVPTCFKQCPYKIVSSLRNPHGTNFSQKSTLTLSPSIYTVSHTTLQATSQVTAHQDSKDSPIHLCSNQNET